MNLKNLKRVINQTLTWKFKKKLKTIINFEL